MPRMTSKTNRSVKGSEELKHVREESPNWVIIVGGALLSTLSIRLCCKVKQIFDAKKSRKTHAPSKGAKHTPISPLSKYADESLTLLKVPSEHSSMDNGVPWASSPDQLELPPKSLNHPKSLGSPCISEFGSDIYNKREAVQKLRQQLKRRDVMIIEMQSQITCLRAQLDSSNQELLCAEREIQRLQKIISECHADVTALHEKPWLSRFWPLKAANGHANGYDDGPDDVELHCADVEKATGADRIEMLKREVKELKEVIEGKGFLIQSYKVQKIELCSNMKELKLRLVSQSSTPNIML